MRAGRQEPRRPLTSGLPCVRRRRRVRRSPEAARSCPPPLPPSCRAARAHRPQDDARHRLGGRRTTEPFVSRVVPVDNVTSYTLRDTQADDLWLGIRSVDREGHRSLVQSFVPPQPIPPALAGRPR